MPKSTAKIPAGTLFTFMMRRENNYIPSVFHALVDFDPDTVLAEWRAQITGEFPCINPEKPFMEWLLQRRFVDHVISKTWLLECQPTTDGGIMPQLLSSLIYITGQDEHDPDEHIVLD